jgi:hypothetical protein
MVISSVENSNTKSIHKVETNIKVVNPKTAKPLQLQIHGSIKTFKACGKLVRAAWVVLTFVLVAIFIPIFPAKQKNAPKIKATTIKIMCVRR